jgi:hypothetical protein
MADPTTPTPVTPEMVQNMVDLNTQSVKASQNMSTLTHIFEDGQHALGMLSDAFNSAGLGLKNIGNLTSEQSTKFGLLTTAIVGAKTSFENFAGVDTGRLNTFNDQADRLFKTLTTPGTAVGAVTEAIQKTKNMLMSFGVQSAEVNRVLEKGPAVLAAYAKNVLTSADNIFRLQNSFIQLTAQAGDVNDLFGELSKTTAGIGDDLSNLNNVTSQYVDVISSSMIATNTKNMDVMAQYASELNRLPGGFKNLLSSMELGGKQTNILTATVQYATGSGRQFADVVQDMRQAMLEFGLSEESSLKFTAQMSDVAGTLHARIEDVRSALTGSVEAFKFFVNGGTNVAQMTKGMTDAMNQYVGSLTSIGVPAQNALDMFKNYTSKVKDMSQAQQAFMSQMTGGPGGLMGGFQIESLIAKDPALLQRKVAETIRKMTGPIVTHDQAESSQSAAAQYTRQIQILQQGPLGSMARTRPEAEQLLEAMRRGTTMAAKKPEDALKDAVDKGSKIEQLSLTKLGEINSNIERLQVQGGIANLNTLQNTLAARTGSTGGSDNAGLGNNVKNQDYLKGVQSKGEAPSMAGGTPTERMFSGLGDLVGNLPASITGSIRSFSENIVAGNRESNQAAHERLMKSTTDNQARGSSGGSGLYMPPSNEYKPAGRQVRAAVPSTSTAGSSGNVSTKTNYGSTVPGNNQPVPVTFAPGTGITVNFTGTCPHCGRGVHTSQQADIQSSPSMAGNK